MRWQEYFFGGPKAFTSKHADPPCCLHRPKIRDIRCSSGAPFHYVSMRAFYFWIWKSKNFKNWWRYDGLGPQILGWNRGILPPKLDSTNFNPPKPWKFRRETFSSKKTHQGHLREKFSRRENEIFVSKKFAPCKNSPKMAIFNLWQIFTPPEDIRYSNLADSTA